MSIADSASAKSMWRGMDYFHKDIVMCLEKINDNEYKSIVKGSGDNEYDVHIDLTHPKRSSCTCPFANGRRVCKHMVATYFAAFPDEANRIIKEAEEYEQEQERIRQEEYERTKKYVYSLSKEELREKLLNYMLSEYDEYDDEYDSEYW